MKRTTLLPRVFGRTLLARSSHACRYLAYWSLMGTLLAASSASAQTNHNDLILNNGEDVVFFLGSPSVGSTFGGSGAPVWGDLYWKALPGDRVLANAHGATGAETMEIDGFVESLLDTDWNTPPAFYDRLIGPAVPSSFAPCALEPAFFSAGLTTEQVVQIGSSGFGNPCTIAPSLCTVGGCPPAGDINGYLVELSLGSTPGTGIVLPADGTSASDAAVTYLLPGGMIATGGLCGSGDYTLQMGYSTDETQADDCQGLSGFGGSHVAGGPPVPDAVHETTTMHTVFRQPILNMVADSGTGLGVESAQYGGGGLNGLKLDTSSGAATLGMEIRDFAGIGQLARVFYADQPLASPQPFLGGYLLVDPDRSTASPVGRVQGTTFIFVSDGVYTSPQTPIPPVPSTLDFWLQGLIYDASSMTVRNTNRVRTTLY